MYVLDTNAFYYAAGISECTYDVEKLQKLVDENEVFISSTSLFEFLIKFRNDIQTIHKGGKYLWEKKIKLAGNVINPLPNNFTGDIINLTESELQTLCSNILENKIDAESRFISILFDMCLFSGFYFSAMSDGVEPSGFCFEVFEKAFRMFANINLEVFVDIFTEGYKTDDCENYVRNCFYNLLAFELEKGIPFIERAKAVKDEDEIPDIDDWLSSEDYSHDTEKLSNKMKAKTSTAFLQRLAIKYWKSNNDPELKNHISKLKSIFDKKVKLTALQDYYYDTKIVQPDIREEVKKVIFMHLKYSPLGTIHSEIAAVKRFSKFLKRKHLDIQSLQDLERMHIEEYLIYLQTEAHDRKNYRSDLYALRRVIEDVGNLYERQYMSELFLSNDFPSTPRHVFKFYSDAEIKRLNEHIFKMDEQICRALIIHQLLGTRISDTLTLKTDCLSMRNNRYFIRIDQVKSVTYEKAISEEVAQLIMKAIDYTKERYGETTYIFTKKEDPTRPYQYSMIQNRIMTMIRQEDIRDDNGEFLKFGTHIFRHCYGKKLTEMHVDDWMIAKLLGHTSIYSVHHYRKIGNKLMADETRAAREKMDMILLDIIEGWDDYEI